jgi:hypothetical protein
MDNLTPIEVARKAWTGEIKEQDAREYLLSKSPRDILEFQNHFPSNQHASSRWFEFTKVILDIRIAEIAAESSNKIVKHTDSLSQQTDILITESRGLSRLTSVLIWLTVSLGLFAVFQIILMVYDIWKHK